MITAKDVAAALAALKLFPVLDGRVTELHARTALEAVEAVRKDEAKRRYEEAHAVEDSCGCIFCDLGYEPVEHDGSLQHHVRVSKGRRKTVPEPSWVPCTLPQ